MHVVMWKNLVDFSSGRGICGVNCTQIFRGGQGIHVFYLKDYIYRQVSNIRRTLVGNKIADHSDVVGASPLGAAPTTSSYTT